MADQRLSDEEIQLRQKARQRLIGAVTLMMAAVVVLPWALDGKPKVHTHEIAVYLPASAPASNEHVAALPAAPANPAPAASAVVTAAPSPARAAAQPGTPAATPGAEDPAAGPQAAPATVEPSQKQVAARAEPPAAAKAAPTVPAHPVTPVQTTHAHPVKPARTTHAHPRLDATETQAGPGATHDAVAADKPASRPVTSGYVLQLGTFSEADNARQLKARLAAKGVPAFTEHLASPGGDRIRVRVGPYPSRAAAEQALSRVNALGLSGVVLNAH